MYFYQFFTERWLAATDELTLVQEAIYLRLLNWMYRNECHLPADQEQCERIARVTTSQERHSVTWILGRFFTCTESGYAQAKALHEIAKFQAGEPVRQARRQLDKERQQKVRNEQHRLYALARQMGLPTRPHMRLAELRELVGEPPVRMVRPVPNVTTSQGASQRDASQDESQTPSQRPEVGKPLTINQENLLTQVLPADAGAAAPPRLAGEGAMEPVPKAEPIAPERIAAAVKALRTGGLVGINGGHPMLLELLRAGIADEALTWASAHAVAKGKPFAYAIAIAEGQMREAAASAAGGLAAPAERNRVSEWAPGLEARR